MGLRERRKEHDDEQGNTEVDDGSRNMRRTLRNGSRRAQRQSSTRRQSTRGDEGANSERAHGQGSRPGTADGEAPCGTRKAPRSQTRYCPSCSASAASGKASCTEAPPQSHAPHRGLVRNRSLASRRTRRRSDRRFDLTVNTQPQTRKEPHHEQDKTHRGFRRNRIRWSRNGRTGRPHGRRGDSTPPPSSSPP